MPSRYKLLPKEATAEMIEACLSAYPNPSEGSDDATCGKAEWLAMLAAAAGEPQKALEELVEALGQTKKHCDRERDFGQPCKECWHQISKALANFQRVTGE